LGVVKESPYSQKERKDTMPLYKITETHICCDTYINIEAKELIYSGDYSPYESKHEDNVGFQFEIQKEVL
jgi:hypothetical protein